MAQFTVHPASVAGSWGPPFGPLRREMDALFDRFFSPARASADWRGVFPPVNLYETADAYVLTAELPGVAPEDIHVSLEGATVTLEGERKIDYGTQDQASLHRAERQAGRFRRAFELPARIEAEKVEAVHRNGVLLLRMPKTPEHQPRRISVQSS